MAAQVMRLDDLLEHPNPLVLVSGLQCRVCGVRMTGPLAGLKETYPNGTVLPLLGYVPALCEECKGAEAVTPIR